MNRNIKIKLFSRFGLNPDIDTINNFTVDHMIQRLTISELESYLNEFRNMMLSRIDKYSQVFKLNHEDANCFLWQMASSVDKSEAIAKALNLWEF